MNLAVLLNDDGQWMHEQTPLSILGRVEHGADTRKALLALTDEPLDPFEDPLRREVCFLENLVQRSKCSMGVVRTLLGGV